MACYLRSGNEINGRNNRISVEELPANVKGVGVTAWEVHVGVAPGAGAGLGGDTMLQEIQGLWNLFGELPQCHRMEPPGCTTATTDTRARTTTGYQLLAIGML